jgi:Flp pilus assembly protein TadG
MRLVRRTEDARTDDTGAAAVEMAIVTPLLLLLLFGIIQYGMLFHTMQAASATARDAATQAATGIQDCDTFSDGVRLDAAGNGIPTNPTPWNLQMDYDTSAGQPNTYGTVEVDLTYTPQDFITFIPMPGELHQKAVAPILNPSEIHVTQCTVDP